MGEALTVEEAALAGGIIGGMFVVLVVIACVWALLGIIACWKIFEKAGEKGWKALIPIYNTYILFKIVGMKNWFWALLLSSIAVGILSSIGNLDTEHLANNSFEGMNLIAFICYILTIAFAFVVTVYQYARLSKVFGHGALFTLGLIFLSGIFMLILGFGKSKYNKKLAKSWDN